VSTLQDPSEWERLDAGEAVEPAIEHRVIRRAPRHIGSGAFACPACDLPLSPAGATAIAARIECPFCRSVRPARQYLRLDTFDTAHNQVQVRARFP
jgi:hypothetical protein